MSIADKITQLTTIRGDIRTALSGKGVSASDHDYADFAADITAIPSGGGGENITLPAEYQKVDYVSSSGTQRIETGLYNSSNGSLIYETEILYPNVSTRQQNGSQGFYYLGVLNNSWQTALPSTQTNGVLAKADTWYKVVMCFTGSPRTIYNASCYISDGSDFNYWKSPSNNDINYQASGSYQICLFALNGQNLPSSCSIKRFRIIKSTILERDFIPCYRKSDKVIGMYDIVNGQFYTNAGTGSFTCYPAPPA